MLIKRTERQARHGKLAAALAGPSAGRLDRRTFLRRSGLVAGGLATLGALPVASMRPSTASAGAARSARLRAASRMPAFCEMILCNSKMPSVAP